MKKDSGKRRILIITYAYLGIYIVIYYINIVKTIWYVLKSTTNNTLKYNLYFYYRIHIMFMIERTTQNKIAKNDKWDYDMRDVEELIVQWNLTKACFAVWTMFYDWFWYYGMSPAEISRVPLWHPWAEFFRDKNKMAARYFKVKYNFSTNEARNMCNTSFPCDFDWAIHFVYYFHDSRSPSR